MHVTLMLLASILGLTSAEDSQGQDHSCGRVLETFPGTVSFSAEQVSMPPTDEDYSCKWTLLAPSGKHVALNFDYIDLRTSLDYDVSMSPGYTFAIINTTEYGTFHWCDPFPPPQTFHSVGNQMEILLVISSALIGGFQFTYCTTDKLNASTFGYRIDITTDSSQVNTVDTLYMDTSLIFPYNGHIVSWAFRTVDGFTVMTIPAFSLGVFRSSTPGVYHLVGETRITTSQLLQNQENYVVLHKNDFIDFEEGDVLGYWVSSSQTIASIDLYGDCNYKGSTITVQGISADGWIDETRLIDTLGDDVTVVYSKQLFLVHGVLHDDCDHATTSGCGSLKYLDGKQCGQMIVSPNYSDSPGVIIECVWEINTTPGTYVSIEFVDFNIQDPSGDGLCTEYISIMESGDNSGSMSQAGTYCGNEMNSSVYISQMNRVQIQFTAVAKEHMSGFRAKVAEIGCGSTLVAVSDVRTLRSVGEAYLSSVDTSKSFACSWLVTSRTVRVFFNVTTALLDNDPNCGISIKIYDVFGEGLLKELTTICNDTDLDNSMLSFVSSEHSLSIQLHIQEGYLYDDVFKFNYFEMDFREVEITDTSEDCGGRHVFQDDAQHHAFILSSPNYPLSYPDDVFCTWIVEAPMTSQLSVIVKDLQIETGSCMFDYLMVVDGFNETLDTILGRSCDDGDKHTSVIKTGDIALSSSNILTVIFKTDRNFHTKGFQLNITTKHVEVTAETRTYRTDVVRNPYYPQFNVNWYTPFIHQWRIIVPDGNKIVMSMLNFSISCMGGHHFTVHDGNSYDAPVLAMASDCQSAPSENVPYIQYNSSGNSMLVTFRCISRKPFSTGSDPANYLYLYMFTYQTERDYLQCGLYFLPNNGYCVGPLIPLFLCDGNVEHIVGEHLSRDRMSINATHVFDVCPMVFGDSSTALTVATNNTHYFIRHMTPVYQSDIVFLIGLHLSSESEPRFTWADNTPFVYNISIIDITIDANSEICFGMGHNLLWRETDCYLSDTEINMDICDGRAFLCQTDLDECMFHYCSHACVNTPGSFYCRCPIGYIIHPLNATQCMDVCNNEIIGLVFGNVSSVSIPSGCVVASSNYLPWNEGHQQCASYGGALLDYNTAELYALELMSDITRYNNFWIDLNDNTTTDTQDKCDAFGSGGSLLQVDCEEYLPTLCYMEISISECSHGIQQINTRATIGVLQSPAFPLHYGSDSVCRWDISVMKGSLIGLHFWNLNLRVSKEETSCLDKLIIYGDETDHSQPFATYCGRIDWQMDVIIPSNVISVEFMSGILDEQLIYSENTFRVLYYRADSSSVYRNSGCGGNGRLTNKEGTVSVQDYDAYTRCKWLIVGEENKYVSMEFSELNIATEFDCTLEKFTIYNGDELKDDALIGVYCIWPVPLIISSTQSVLIEFISTRIPVESLNGHYGFSFKYKIVDCAGCAVGMQSSVEMYTEYVCTSSRPSCGVITSINYPSNYPLLSTINWRLTGPPGTYVHFTVPDDHFRLREESSINKKDCLEARDTVTGSEMELCSNIVSQAEFKSSQNTMIIEFVSHGSYGAGGTDGEFNFYVTYEFKQYSPSIEIKLPLDNVGDCPPGWISQHGNCYQFGESSSSLTWPQAEDECISRDAHLVSIKSYREMAFIQTMLTSEWLTLNELVYIGLSDAESTEGWFVWTDGSPLSYTDWLNDNLEGGSTREPSGGKYEGCVVIKLDVIHSTKNWKDYACASNLVHKYICKNKAIPVDSEYSSVTIGDMITQECEYEWYRNHNTCYRIITVFEHQPRDNSTEISVDALNRLCEQYNAEIASNVSRDVVNLLNRNAGIQWRRNVTVLWIGKQTNNVGEYGYNDDMITLNKRKIDNTLCLSLIYEKEWKWLECDFTAIDDGVDFNGGVLCAMPTKDVSIVCPADYFRCNTSGECILKEYICDGIPDCKDTSDEFQCDTVCSDDSFTCDSGQCISLSFYCDFTPQCEDGSDEYECVLRDCLLTEFQCDNGQCIDGSLICNVKINCADGSDENVESCRSICDGFLCFDNTCFPSFVQCDGMVDCEGSHEEDEYLCSQVCSPNEITCENGACADISTLCMYDYIELDNRKYHIGCRDVTHLRFCDDYSCPPYTFKCPSSYCIPLYRRCDGQNDCPDGEDEYGCNQFSCPGSYKCQSTHQCIELNKRCDGKHDCIKGDDEHFCDIQCLEGCNCASYLFDCSQSSWFELPDDLSSNIRGLKINRDSVTRNSQLSQYEESNGTIKWNTLFFTKIGMFERFSWLANLELSGNGIESFLPGTFGGLSNLLVLNLKNNRLFGLQPRSFDGLSKLRKLLLTGNPILSIENNAFVGLSSLTSLYSDEYFFCCLATTYTHAADSLECTPEADMFSSCEELMESEVLRICVWILGLSAFLGNIFVIIWRMRDTKEREKGHSILIVNLGCADFLMGIYMLIIASVDMLYRGNYSVYDYDWRHSWLCNLCGFLSTVSSEVSVFTLTVITADRFICIVFPFSTRKMNKQSAYKTCLLGWIIVIMIAAIPMLPINYFGNGFYARTGVCLPLQLTSATPPGWEYSIAIFLVINLISFFMIFIAYLVMFVVVKKSSSRVACGNRRGDAAIARRMTAIVMTDFFCWVPIIIMSIVGMCGGYIPRDLYAVTAVFILPLNSSINPILYTVSTIKFRKRNATSVDSTERMALSQAKRNEKYNSRLSVIRALGNGRFLPLILEGHSTEFRLRPLKHYLLYGQTLSTRDVTNISRDIAESIEMLHKMKLVHTQINEDHVLIEETYQGAPLHAHLIGTPSISETAKNGYSTDVFQFGRLVESLVKQIQNKTVLDV
uniref:Uncharacterized protein LOC102803992 n=1 Tax=Saccoglossus kowalevskii TaxID=10224 RepID=A0ABM0LZ26_SACKO|nr:PREDICTED: uncharacterized protein LOC102803992 [Saccoglossus kowalevskii]